MPSFEDIGNKMGISIVGALRLGCNVSEKHIEMTLRDTNAIYSHHCFSMVESDKAETISFEVDSIRSNISSNLIIEFRTNIDEIVSFKLIIDPYALDTATGALLAAIILILLNVLIVSEVSLTARSN